MPEVIHRPVSFIGGKEVEGSDETMIFTSPIDGKKIGESKTLSSTEVSSAFLSANMAFDNWSQVDYQTRVKFILAFASKLREHSSILSQIIHKETGKSYKAAFAEVQRSYEYIVESAHAYSDMMEKLDEYNHDNSVLMPPKTHATYVRCPLGVVLTISPFNYPVNLMITKVVPALLTGNCVVHKSATQGTISGWYVAKLINEVTVDGFLITPGSFNYLIGKGSKIGDWFGNEKEIHAFSFTGSSSVGRSITKVLPSGIPIQLEMGGHNPAVVMPKADLDLSVGEIMKGAFSFSGQRCTSIKRVLVHGSLRSKFIDKLQKSLDDLKLEEPLINESSANRVSQCYEDAMSKGAVRVGKEFIRNGNYVSPVVFMDVKKDMIIYSEEVFGPVLAISFYEHEEEIVAFCNDSRYGLQASIFGDDTDHMAAFALKLEFGRVNINSAPARSPDCLPFGGFKESGVGFQSITESLLFFTTKKGIFLKE